MIIIEMREEKKKSLVEALLPPDQEAMHGGLLYKNQSQVLVTAGKQQKSNSLRTVS
jgi:hypothetical protein